MQQIKNNSKFGLVVSLFVMVIALVSIQCKNESTAVTANKDAKTEMKQSKSNAKASKSKGNQGSKSRNMEMAFKTHPIPLMTPMMRSGDPYFMEGMKEYHAKKFGNALAIWEKLPPESFVGQDTLNMYIAGVHFFKEDYKTAVPYFEKSLKARKSTLRNEANWFLAVCHTYLNNKTKALSYLNKCSNDYTEYLRTHIELNLD